MPKKSLLIINRMQFGYHTDSFKYCQYLKDEFDITYICFDTDNKKIIEESIKVIYVPREGSFFKKGFNFIGFCRTYIKNHNIDLILIVYFQMASLIKLVSSNENFILDIRTADVNKTSRKRKINDAIMLFESKLFKNITIITESLRERLNIDEKKTHILPLGSDAFTTTNKSYTNLHLLYVGTLDNRRIFETVYGLKIFLENNNIAFDITYDIVGFGNRDETHKLIDAIDETELHDVVEFHGKISHDKLKPLFEKCNIGISYVPITKYFDCQPPTKTFEYVVSGLACIATMTKENKKLINKENGVLCMDDIFSFAKALEKLNKTKLNYSSEYIRETLKVFTWKNIVNDNLKPLIYKVCND